MYFLEEVVLPPGEKIRRIRGYLGLKQHDITGGKITRNLISYIENGKTKLVEDTAKIVVSSMNEWAEKKKIPLDIDVEYIMRDEIGQAKVLLGKYLNNLKKYINDQNEEFEHELNEAKKILKDWDIIDKKAEIHEISGDYYYKQEHFNESHINYVKSLENYIKNSNHLKIALLYFKLGRCAIWLNNYQEAINLNNYALLILEKHNICDELIIKKSLFNNALAYKKLECYDESLFQLEKLESMIGDKLTEPQYVDILMLKGNCYFGKQNYSDAEKIYMEIIVKDNDLETEAKIYFNLGEISYEYNKFEKSIEYINKSLEIRRKINSFFLTDSYLILGKIFNSMQNYDLAEKTLLSALQEAKKRKKLLMQAEIYDELLNCYMYSNQDNSIDKLLQEVEEIITENVKGIMTKELFFRASYYYIEKDIKKSKELLEIGLKMKKK